jgi:5'-deoxynucleotidase YfbR-like HD superfamily hydrolase
MNKFFRIMKILLYIKNRLRLIMNDLVDFFNNFLKIQVVYALKEIPRNSSNHYYDEKDHVLYFRRETTAEHISSCQRLADYFFETEREFFDLDRLLVYDLIMYHDDPEIITRDTGISEIKKREHKEEEESAALPVLAAKYPDPLGEKLIRLFNIYKANSIPETRFVHAIDKLDSLVHELKYTQDWAPKGFDEKFVRKAFGPSFEYSPTFKKYFERMILYLNSNGHFNTQLSVLT